MNNQQKADLPDYEGGNRFSQTVTITVPKEVFDRLREHKRSLLAKSLEDPSHAQHAWIGSVVTWQGVTFIRDGDI